MDTTIPAASRSLLIAAAVALALAGCASAPRTDARLESAHQLVAAAHADPGVTGEAGTEMALADAALARADGLMAKDKPLEAVDHEAYLAGRYARAAEEHGSLLASSASLANQDNRRNAVLLAARTRDARVAVVIADEATAVASDARDSAAAAGARADMLDAQLVALQAQQTDRGIVVTLGDVLFSTGKSDLRESSLHSIAGLVGFLAAHPERTVRVEGYTDSVGSDEFNRGLSDRRAASVTDALERGGIAASRIQAEGLGNTRPIASNDSADGRRQNRRVEIVISQAAGVVAVGRQSPL